MRMSNDKQSIPAVFSPQKKASTSGVKTTVKKTSTTTTTETKAITVVKKEEKKVKKVFSLPGQKHEAPEERDPLRIFYESLHEQIPESEMAQIWMMEHGLLEVADAKKALDKKTRRLQNERNGTPMKSLPAPSRDNNGRAVTKTSLSNGKSSNVPEKKVQVKPEPTKDHNGKLGNKSTLPIKNSLPNKTSLPNKSNLSNGKNDKTLEQKGKRKRDYSSDDDDYVQKPVKRKLKP